MKIVMLCEFFHESLEFQENLLAKYYLKHGHEVTVITSTYESVFDYYSDTHDNNTPASTKVVDGIKLVRLRFRYNILHRLRAYTSIAGILNEERPDLIYVHDIMLNFPEAIAYVKRHPETKMIMDYHCDYSNSGRNQLSLRVLHGVIRKWFIDRARPHLSRIFPVVPAGITFLREIYKVPAEEMEVLPLGADTDYCDQVRRSGAGRELRAALGFRDDEIVIFTGGKLAPTKKTEILIEAMGLLPDLPLRVVIAGDARPADHAYKMSLLEKAAADARIRFVGWLDKEAMYRYMDMVDIAVFPASQSIVWQQAIAMGLPLVVGDVGGQDVSYLNLEKNIVMLPRHRITAPDLAQAIREIVTVPGRLAQMAAGALKVADEHLNWNKLIYRTLRFNQEVPSRYV